MAVLVTGGAGFIGSHVVDALIESGFDVVVADNMSFGNLSNVNKKAKLYECDILSPEFEQIFVENNIEFVSHHAAQPSVSYSTKFPLEDAKNNILVSINVLEMCKKYGIKKIAVASTAAVYGFPEYLPVDEKHPVTVLSNYGLSKHTMERYVQVYSKTYGFDYIIFRYSNVYGPRQNCQGEAGVIAIFAEKMLKGENIQIHGDGEQTRDFLYVKDTAKANVLALKSDVKNEIINISTATALSINDMYKALENIIITGKTPTYTEERQGDIKHSSLDSSKAQRLLGWNPETSIEDGLLETINYFRNPSNLSSPPKI